ncbi:MAG: DUF3576 domain-containing protein, partial [Pseudomonadota bacterium]
MKRIWALGFISLILAACSGGKAPTVTDRENDRFEDAGSILGGPIILGPGGGLLGGDSGSTGSGIAVNAHLWRASLDTISFLPLDQADPFGGVITTDWYRSNDASEERYKMNVYILGRELRANALRVVVFRQNLQPDGTWFDDEVQDSVAGKIEDAILVRARQLRIAERQAAT